MFGPRSVGRLVLKFGSGSGSSGSSLANRSSSTPKPGILNSSSPSLEFAMEWPVPGLPRSTEGFLFLLSVVLVYWDWCSERTGLSVGKEMGEFAEVNSWRRSSFLAVGIWGVETWPSFRKRTVERALPAGVLGEAAFSSTIAWEGMRKAYLVVNSRRMGEEYQRRELRGGRIERVIKSRTDRYTWKDGVMHQTQ